MATARNSSWGERWCACVLNPAALPSLSRGILKKAERGETHHEHQSCPVAPGLHHRRPSVPHQYNRHHGASGVV
jgi:hypothetical protein